MRRVIAYLTTERGHHRITIDSATANRAAIRAYEKAGFGAVGVMCAYERDLDGDGWHDGLLMELVVCPGPREAGDAGNAGKVIRAELDQPSPRASERRP